jgi:hypothetical protein
MSRWLVIAWLMFTMPLSAHHDEPGSYLEYELKQELFAVEASVTELFYQLTYVPVSVRPRVYQELRDLQQRWNEIIAQLIEIDLTEHPQP